MSLFLTPIEMRELTGFAVKAKQIEQLRRMGIPFFINGCGKPVVTVAAVEGRHQESPPLPAWRPAVLEKSNASNDAGATQSNKGKRSTAYKHRAP